MQTCLVLMSSTICLVLFALYVYLNSDVVNYREMLVTWCYHTNVVFQTTQKRTTPSWMNNLKGPADLASIVNL